MSEDYIYKKVAGHDVAFFNYHGAGPELVMIRVKDDPYHYIELQEGDLKDLMEFIENESKLYWGKEDE